MPSMVVRLDVWGVRGLGIARAFGHMGSDRLALRGLSTRPEFAKLLGTGSGESFTMRDSDPRHWALLTVWRDQADCEALEPLLRTWSRFAVEHAVFTLRPLASHGQWSGREPFASEPIRWEGPVAAITRARIRPREWFSFWRSVPPVSADLKEDPSVLFTLGIGEAPVGLQGTFSVWSSAQAIRDFAYRRPAHREVIERTKARQWYSEELFARFAVLGMSGGYRGSPVA